MLVWLQSFLMCRRTDADRKPVADLHVGIKGKDENLKGLFGGSTLDRNLFRKEKESHSQSSVFLSDERVALPQSLFFIVPSSADTGKRKDCSYVFTEASLLPHPQSDLRLFHQHCLSLKTTFILGQGEREKVKEKKRRKKNSTSGQ